MHPWIRKINLVSCVALTDGRRDVPGEDLLALPDGQLRPQLEPQVGELDVVGVVEARVVDEAVHRVQRHTGATAAHTEGKVVNGTFIHNNNFSSSDFSS